MNGNITEEFDICTHGDLVSDYLCHECTYNRWRVERNDTQPPQKKKIHPVLLDIGHRVNIGNLRDISIKRAVPKSPEKATEVPAPTGNESEDAGEKKSPNTKPENKENIAFKLPSYVNLSKTGDAKAPSFNFSKLPSGISITAFKPTADKNDIPSPPSPAKNPPSASDPMEVIRNVNWSQVFQFSGLNT